MKKITMLLTILIFSKNALSDDTNIIRHHIDLTPPFNVAIFPGSPDYGTGEYNRNYDMIFKYNNTIPTNIPNIQVDNK